MGTQFTARLDGSNSIRHLHVPLTLFYLEQAEFHVKAAVQTAEAKAKFKESLLAIIFSSMCLESFANEMAESTLRDDELDDFFRLKGKYQSNIRGARTCIKLKLLFSICWSVELSLQETPLKEVDELLVLRNELVHYRVTKTSGKAHMPQAAIRTTESGGGSVKFDFTSKPVRIEEPMVARINERSAADAYDVTLHIIKRWNEATGVF